MSALSDHYGSSRPFNFVLGFAAPAALMLALLIGVGVGTYSSVYVAGTLLVWLKLTRDDLIPPVVEEEADERP